MDYIENKNIHPSTIKVDPTLSKYGYAADSRVVGIMLNKLANFDKDNLLGGVDNKSIYIYTDPDKYGEDDLAGVLAIRGFYEATSGSYFKVVINPKTNEPEIVWDTVPSDINDRMIQLAQLLEIKNDKGEDVVDVDTQDWIDDASFDASKVVDDIKDDINVVTGDVAYAHQRIDALEDSIPKRDEVSITVNNFDKWLIAGFEDVEHTSYPRAQVDEHTGELTLEWVLQLLKILIQVGLDNDPVEITDPTNPDANAIITFRDDNFADIDTNNKVIKLSWAKWE